MRVPETSPILEKARSQIAANKTKDCLSFLYSNLKFLDLERPDFFRFRDGTLHLQNRYSSLKMDRDQDIIPVADYRLELSKLVKSVIEFLSEIEESICSYVSLESPKPDDKRYLSELTLDKDFEKTTESETLELMMNLAKTANISPEELISLSKRAGSIILELALSAESIVKIKSLLELGIVKELKGVKVLDSSWSWIEENKDFHVYLPKGDLSGIDLSGKNLKRAELSKVNISNSDLRGVDFSNSNLIGANLSKALLNGANLAKILLHGGIFKGASLRGINLEGSNLRMADFTNVDLRGANFTNADLRGADFTNADLRGADFTNADLRGADFTNADLRGADFTNAIIDIDIKGEDFKGKELIEVGWGTNKLADTSSFRKNSKNLYGLGNTLFFATHQLNLDSKSNSNLNLTMVTCYVTSVKAPGLNSSLDLSDKIIKSLKEYPLDSGTNAMEIFGNLYGHGRQVSLAVHYLSVDYSHVDQILIPSNNAYFDTMYLAKLEFKPLLYSSDEIVKTFIKYSKDYGFKFSVYRVDALKEGIAKIMKSESHKFFQLKDASDKSEEIETDTE